MTIQAGVRGVKVWTSAQIGSGCVSNLMHDGVALRFRKSGHGAGMRRNPGAPAIAGGVEPRQRRTAQVVMRQRSGEGIPSADGIDHLHRIARMTVDFIARDQQTPLGAQA